MDTKNVKEINEVEHFLTHYANAVNNADLKALSELFTDNGIFMPDGFPSIKGKEAILKSTHKFNYENLFKISYLVVSLEVQDSYAFVEASATAIVGETKKLTRDFFLLTKESGEWKVLRYIFNSKQ